MNFSIISLGCAKNFVDSEIITNELLASGLNYVNDFNDADLVIINTCSFIESAKEESINTILETARDKKFKLLVGGCLPQRYKDDIFNLFPEVDGWFGVDGYKNLHSIIDEVINNKKARLISEPSDAFTEYSKKKTATPGSWAYVKIAEGCNHSCSFCIIPKIRGRFRSREKEKIVNEVRELVSGGYSEIVLVAQDTTFYGFDLYGKKCLAELLKSLCAIGDLKWLRVLYLNPESIDENLINTIAENEQIIKYLDIPFQHCSKKILKNMKRSGGKEEYLKLIGKLRKRIPGIVLRSTFIIGFPGETEEDFEELVSFIKEVRFHRAGFFAYSREEDTEAFKLKNQIKNTVKENRIAKIAGFQREISFEYNKELLGKSIQVVVDMKKNPHDSSIWKGISKELGNFYHRKIREKDIKYLGRTRWDAPEIDGMALIIDEPEKSDKKNDICILKSGDILDVKVIDVSPYDIISIQAKPAQ